MLTERKIKWITPPANRCIRIRVCSLPFHVCWHAVACFLIRRTLNEKLWVRISHVVKCFSSITKANLWAKFTPHFEFWETLIFQLPRTCDSGVVFEKVMINHVLPPRWSFSASSFKKLLVARQIQLWLHKESVCWCGRKTTGKIRLRTATTEGKSRQESSFERRNFSPCFSSSLSKVHKLFQR